MDWLGLSDLSSYKERRVYRGAFLFSPAAECGFFPLNRSELPPAFFPVKFFPMLFPLFPERFPVSVIYPADSPYLFRLFPDRPSCQQGGENNDHAHVWYPFRLSALPFTRERFCLPSSDDFRLPAVIVPACALFFRYVGVPCFPCGSSAVFALILVRSSPASRAIVPVPCVIPLRV